jgi:hypothetical protein
MRTSAEFISSMRKLSKSTQFACYVRNLTDHAIRVEVPFGTLEKAPKMTPAQHAFLIERNRQRFAVNPDEARPTATSHDKAQQGTDPAPSAPAAAAEDWRS